MRLIDADAIPYDQLLKTGNKVHPLEWAVSQSRIDNMPTINAEPVKHGKWIKVEDDYNNHLYECSYCHTWTSLPNEEVDDGNIRYCWSCGAKMYGVKK